MNILKEIWKWLISAPPNNKYNGHPEKKGYMTKHDIESWGEAGKARPINGCLEIIFYIILATYLIRTIIHVLKQPAPF